MATGQVGPKLVNEGADTSPSKRIKGCWPGYSKTVDGPDLIAEAGLEAVRQACPHFDEWVRWLEQPDD